MADENTNVVTPAAASASSGDSLVERLTREYNIKPGTKTQPEEEHSVSDDFTRGYERRVKKLEQISDQLGTREKQRTSTAPDNEIDTQDRTQLYARLSKVQLDMAQFASDYKGIMTSFQELIGSDLLTTGEKLGLWFRRSVRRNERVAKEYEIKACTNKGLNLDKLVDALAKILDREHQTALEGTNYLQEIRVGVIEHLKKMKQEAIEGLRNSYRDTPEQATAEASLMRLQKDLDHIDRELANYEMQVSQARTTKNVDEVKRLTDEMLKLVEVQDALFDTKLETDQELFGIRRGQMDMAKRVQSAKGAIAATRLNYQTTNTLIEAYSDMEITFRYDLEHNIRVFKDQAILAIAGAKLEDMGEMMLRKADLALRTQELSVQMSTYAATKSFELLKSSQYDPKVERDLEANMVKYRDNMNKLRDEWVTLQTTVEGIDTTKIHYQEQG